jgi:hypothetical protein
VNPKPSVLVAILKLMLPSSPLLSLTTPSLLCSALRWSFPFPSQARVNEAQDPSFLGVPQRFCFRFLPRFKKAQDFVSNLSMPCLFVCVDFPSSFLQLIAREGEGGWEFRQ